MGKIAATRLRDKMIVTEQGHEIGTLFDMVINEDTGELIALVVEPTTDVILNNMITDKENLVLVPFSAVRAVKDFIIVDVRRIPKKSERVGMFAKVPE